MPANNSDGDGIMDRMAKRLFASPDSPFTAFADRQRVERLEQCRQLERILTACQAANDAQATAGTTILSDKEAFPPSKSGVRIARFFKWEDSADQEAGQDITQQTDSRRGGIMSEAAASFYDDSGNDGGSNQLNVQSKKSKRSRFSKSCAREAHELWACRALALGCGNHLADLRRCWNDTTLKSAVGDAEISFENGSEEACRNIQIDMSKCVNKNAAELAQRVQAAKKPSVQ